MNISTIRHIWCVRRLHRAAAVSLDVAHLVEMTNNNVGLGNKGAIIYCLFNLKRTLVDVEGKNCTRSR